MSKSSLLLSRTGAITPAVVCRLSLCNNATTTTTTTTTTTKASSFSTVAMNNNNNNNSIVSNNNALYNKKKNNILATTKTQVRHHSETADDVRQSMGGGTESDGRPLYLDLQATTPTDPRVLDAMMPYMTHFQGNPHSVTHKYGWETSDAVEDAREHVANVINAGAKEIVFTSGATESNNIAIKGIARFY